MRNRALRGWLTLLALSAAALAIGGCDGAKKATPAAMQLEREDVALVGRTLASIQPAVAGEVAASKAAWPYVADGLRGSGRATGLSPAALSAIQTASRTATAVKLPALFGERRAESITGPAAGMAALFRSYLTLATRGWQMIAGADAEIEHGSPAAVRFARASVNLYIDSVYDAHFSVAQLGKQLLAAYKKLGAEDAFAISLTQAEVDALAGAYSEPSDRLYPHPTVKLGS